MIIKVFLLLYLIQVVSCSNGDSSKFYKRCVSKCLDLCISNNETMPLYMTLMGWDLMENCKYECMWPTVERYKQRGYSAPQFYGKWPFVRVLGIQEPASVIFSFFNGVTNVIGFLLYKQTVPAHAPMYKIVVAQNIVAVNAWLWSCVYHARDFLLTERLDYFCATSLVLFNFYVALHRIAFFLSDGTSKLFRWSAAIVLCSFFLVHISYLSFYKFDYSYNMKANVTCGILSSVTWLSFCFFNRKHLFVWKCALVVILTNLFLLFEVFDFSPLFWIWDAHSIWHLLTIPLPISFFLYLRDDCMHLMTYKELEEDKIKLL